MAVLRHGREPARRLVPGGPLAALGRVLALSTVALLAAACSSGGSGRQVAGLPGHSGGPARSTVLTQAQADQDFVNFAHCMRSHGVQMPDPFHRPGHVGLSIELPPHDAATRAAWAVCDHYVRPVIAMKQAGAASMAAPNLDALTRYAQCMRAHDINMLDPTSFGALNLGNVPGITSNYGRYSPQFRAADAACKHLLPPGVNDNGSGP
jgi:hypothetical protein